MFIAKHGADVASDREEKRRELDRVNDHIERLEREGADAKLISQYRALARQIADRIKEWEGRRGG